MKSAWDRNWDGLYVDAHGVTKSAWDKRWETLDDNLPSPQQNDLNHARGFPTIQHLVIKMESHLRAYVIIIL